MFVDVYTHGESNGYRSNMIWPNAKDRSHDVQFNSHPTRGKILMKMEEENGELFQAARSKINPR